LTDVAARGSPPATAMPQGLDAMRERREPILAEIAAAERAKGG
jgi:hypothetical protein